MQHLGAITPFPQEKRQNPEYPPLQVMLINPEKSKRTISMLQQHELADSVYVDGISCKNMSPSEMLSECGVSPELLWTCSPDETGSFLSHRHMWKQIITRNLDYALVLENNIKVIDDNARAAIHRTVNKAPKDWDIILLHRSMNSDYYPVDNILDTSTNWIGLLAYLITQTGAKRLLKLTVGCQNPIDHQIRQITNSEHVSLFVRHQPLFNLHTTKSNSDPTLNVFEYIGATLGVYGSQGSNLES